MSDNISSDNTYNIYKPILPLKDATDLIVRNFKTTDYSNMPVNGSDTLTPYTMTISGDDLIISGDTYQNALKTIRMSGVDDWHALKPVRANSWTEWFKDLPNVMPLIEKVIFQPPATIVMWADGTKTVVKTHDEEFSEEHGLAMAIAKKYFGNNRSMFLKAVKGAKRRPLERRPVKKEADKPKVKKKAASKAKKTVK